MNNFYKNILLGTLLVGGLCAKNTIHAMEQSQGWTFIEKDESTEQKIIFEKPGKSARNGNILLIS